MRGQLRSGGYSPPIWWRSFESEDHGGLRPTGAGPKSGPRASGDYRLGNWGRDLDLSPPTGAASRGIGRAHSSTGWIAEGAEKNRAGHFVQNDSRVIGDFPPKVGSIELAPRPPGLPRGRPTFRDDIGFSSGAVGARPPV